MCRRVVSRSDQDADRADRPLCARDPPPFRPFPDIRTSRDRHRPPGDLPAKPASVRAMRWSRAVQAAVRVTVGRRGIEPRTIGLKVAAEMSTRSVETADLLFCRARRPPRAPQRSIPCSSLDEWLDGFGGLVVHERQGIGDVLLKRPNAVHYEVLVSPRFPLLPPPQHLVPRRLGDTIDVACST